MLEIADLFCSDKTNTPQIFRTETFYHLTFVLTPGEARFHHGDELKPEKKTSVGHAYHTRLDMIARDVPDCDFRLQI